MDRLIELHLAHSAAPEVEAAWLHHRFTQIHPFQDGNGRVARALASLILIRAGWFPLVIRDHRDERTAYLDALEAADLGQIQPLVDVVAATQRRAFVQALGLSDQVLRLSRAEQVIQATKSDLTQRSVEHGSLWEGAKDLAHRLLATANERFGTIADMLKFEMEALLPESQFWSDFEPYGSARDHYFRWQIVQVARQLDYFANVQDFRSWVRLVLRTPSQSEILISFHVAGPTYRGILVASASFFRLDETEDGTRQATDVEPLSGELFQLNYLETKDQVQDRFQDWLEEVLVRGLEHWRQAL